VKDVVLRCIQILIDAYGESRSFPIPDTVETFTGEGGEEAELT
jgi:hypothetical protein